MKSTYIIITLGFLTLFSCKENEPETAENPETETAEVAANTVTQAQFDAMNFALGKMETKAFNAGVTATGSIDVPPENRAIVSPVMGGYIVKNPLLEGDYVKRGDLLAVLEDPAYVELQQQYAESVSQLDYLKSEYERQKTLYDEKITSQKNYLKAESDYKRTNSQVNALAKKLRMLSLSPERVAAGNISSTVAIYAPITGKVSHVEVSRGSYVNPSDHIMEIIDTEHIHLELNVFEKDMLKIAKEQKIEFKIPESSKETYQGEVHLLGNTINEPRRTIKVHGHIAESKAYPDFAVGMFVEAKILIDEYESMALPSEAVIELNGNHFALALEKKEGDSYTFKRVVIEPGVTENGFTEIKNAQDLDASKQFLTSGAYALIQ